MGVGYSNTKLKIQKEERNSILSQHLNHETASQKQISASIFETHISE
jgi:hypothetical protein